MSEYSIFSNLGLVILDMDDCMYKKSLKIGDEFVSRLTEYCNDILKLRKEETDNILSMWNENEELVIKHLRDIHGVDEANEKHIPALMDYVCSLENDNYDLIDTNSELKEQLKKFPKDIKLMIYTNTTHKRIGNIVGGRLGVLEYIDECYTTKEAGYLFKHNPKAFEKFFKTYSDIDPNKTVMVEDNPKYLKSAKQLGLKTVLVVEGSQGVHKDKEKYPYVDFIVENINQALKIINEGMDSNKNQFMNNYGTAKGRGF